LFRLVSGLTVPYSIELKLLSNTSIHHNKGCP
jgi:hypothetical protein